MVLATGIIWYLKNSSLRCIHFQKWFETRENRWQKLRFCRLPLILCIYTRSTRKLRIVNLRPRDARLVSATNIYASKMERLLREKIQRVNAGALFAIALYLESSYHLFIIPISINFRTICRNFRYVQRLTQITFAN